MSTNEKWHVDPRLPLVIVDESGRDVAAVFLGQFGSHEAQAKTEARARLIALAPEMAEALRELMADKYLADPINADRMAKASTILSKLEAKQ